MSNPDFPWISYALTSYDLRKAWEISRGHIAVISGERWLGSDVMISRVREPSFPTLPSLSDVLTYKVASIVHYCLLCVRYDMVVNVQRGLGETVPREVLI